jgi:hypothetical protein
LVPLAGLGLSLVMLLAILYHAARGEYQNIGFNVLLLVASAFVAYGRWRLVPLKDRSQASEA